MLISMKDKRMKLQNIMGKLYWFSGRMHFSREPNDEKKPAI